MVKMTGRSVTEIVFAFIRPEPIDTCGARPLSVAFLERDCCFSPSDNLTIKATAHPFPRTVQLKDFMSASLFEACRERVRLPTRFARLPHAKDVAYPSLLYRFINAVI